MAALGLILRRVGMLPHPATEEGVVFYNGLVGDGNAYIKIPEFTIVRSDTLILRYTMETNDGVKMVFGMRWGEGCAWAAEMNARSYAMWFAANGASMEASGVAGFFGVNKTIKTMVGYSSQYGQDRRLWTLDGSIRITSNLGDLEQKLTKPLFVFASNTPNSETIDSRIFSGTIHEFIIETNAGEKKLHLLPAAKFGVPGMYDKVGDVFYENAGSGQFTLV